MDARTESGRWMAPPVEDALLDDWIEARAARHDSRDGGGRAKQDARAEGGRDCGFTEALLGAGLPPAAEQHLHAAGRAWHEDALAERHLREAKALAPEHAAVLIGLYRFYFYKNRLDEALSVARICLDKAARDNGLAADWRRVRRGDADFGSYDAMLPRFYLFTLKAYGYLQMRLGNLTEGRAALVKLLELDPSDKLGARVLLGVLDRMGRDDDD